MGKGGVRLSLFTHGQPCIFLFASFREPASAKNTSPSARQLRGSGPNRLTGAVLREGWKEGAGTGTGGDMSHKKHASRHGR
jgi:hypothetical protein